MTKTAILLGASGLIGSQLLSKLIESDQYDCVKVFVRKDLHYASKKVEQHIVDFNKVSDLGVYISGDSLFCCLGSTQSKTPDKNDYRKVDFGYTLAFAKMALANGASQIHLVSSIGADTGSKNFYLNLKGEIEEAIEQLHFQSTNIYRPSLLLGDRNESRFGEKLARLIMPLLTPVLIGPFKKYRAIKAETVASAMLKQSLKALSGVFIYPSEEIKILA